MKQKEEWQRRPSERRSLYLFAGFLLSAIGPRDSLTSGISSPVRSSRCGRAMTCVSRLIIIGKDKEI